MNKSRLKLKGRWSNMPGKQTREGDKLFLIQEIGVGEHTKRKVTKDQIRGRILLKGEGMMETKEAQVEAQRAQGPKMHCKDLEA